MMTRWLSLWLLGALPFAIGCTLNSTSQPPNTKTAVQADGSSSGAGALVEQGGKVTLSANNTKITFVGTKPTGKHDGGFKQFEGSARLDGAKLTAVEAEINTDTLWADDPKLTNHL